MRLTPKQKQAAVKLHRTNGGAVWWRVGEGKTRIALRYFAFVAKDFDVVPRVLVVCRRESFNDWSEEIGRCGLDGWHVRPIEAAEDMFAVPAHKPVIYLLSHGMLSRTASELIEIAGTILAVVYDEGWLYKNPRTKHCKSANKLSEAVGNAAILSGSMMTARDLTDVYGQLYAIGKHDCLARTLTEFNGRFMFRFQINPNQQAAASCWRAARGAGQRIAARIRGCSSVYFPHRHTRKYVRDVRCIPPTPDQTRAFTELRKLWQLTVKDNPPMLMKMVPTIMTKCQQISDGWVSYSSPRTEGGSSIVTFASAKLDYLVTQVADLVMSGERVVIWCAFRHSVTMILQRLQKSFPKLGIYSMVGGTKFNYEGWKRNGWIAVCTEASGSAINYFQHCAYAIYYSHDASWRNMQQSLGRTDRKSSRHDTCYYYFLQTKGSMDARIHSLVHSSRNEESNLINETLTWLKQTTLS